MSEKTWPNWNPLKRALRAPSLLPFPCLKRRGPIETKQQAARIAELERHFHVWKDVAQLKLEIIVNLRITLTLHISMSEKTWPNWNTISQKSLHFNHLRWHISMSEKTWPNWNLFLPFPKINSVSPYFHVWKDVAQLKHHGYALAGKPGFFFADFHVWKDVAQLKRQVLLGFLDWDLSIFPCLKRRGPIETPQSFPILVPLSSNFHVWKDVAQLKHQIRDRITPTMNHNFHVWKDVAQLKPVGDSLRFISVGYLDFHVWKDVAQLKHQYESRDVNIIEQISMSEKTWPNWNPSFSKIPSFFHLKFPCLKRRGPIETQFAQKDTWIFLCISMSEKTWPNWNQLAILCVSFPSVIWISMSEKTWPNWNSYFCNLSAFPNHINFHVWKDVAQLKHQAFHRFFFSCHFQDFHVWKDVAQLKHQYESRDVNIIEQISMSEKTWPNWNFKV